MSAAPAATALEIALSIIVSTATDVGGREGNEDALLAQELPPIGEGSAATDGGYLLAIADGMGGHHKGEVASQLSVEAVAEAFGADPGGDTALVIKQAFRRANEQIFSQGQGAEPPIMMGTTLVVCANRGKYATIASIGDSRAYLVRANRLTQITKDHSLVADQVARGEITEEEARESPHRNILTHAIGQRPKLDSKMPNIFEITLLPEDKLLLCTDGFFDVMPDQDILATLLSSRPERAAEDLVQIAVQRGTSDNVTAIVASVLPQREPMSLPTASSGKGGVPLYVIPIAALLILGVIIFLLSVL